MMDAIENEVNHMMMLNEPLETAGMSSCRHNGSAKRETNKPGLVSQFELRNSHSQWSCELEKLPLLTRKEEVELATRMEQKDAEARDRFIESNLMLVIGIARRYRGCGVPMEDLIQEATLSLAKAADAFDHRQGCRFSAWAGIQIEGEIGRRVSEIWKTTAARCPRHSEHPALPSREARIHHEEEMTWDLSLKR